MRRRELAVDSTDGLRGAHAVDYQEFVVAALQRGQHLLADFALDPDAVGAPLVVEVWAGEGLADGLLEVDDVDDGEQRLRDDGGSARRAHREDGLAVL